MVGKFCANLNDADIEILDALMVGKNIQSPTALFRTLLRETVAPRALVRTDTQSVIYREVARRLDVEASVTECPLCSADGLEQSLAVATHHTSDVLAGVIPLVPDTVHEAGLDPHSKYAWDTYYKELIPLFTAILRRPMSVDLRFEPLDFVAGQYAGAVVGTVTDRTRLHPIGEAIRAVQYTLDSGARRLHVRLRGDGHPLVGVGATIYVAGVFVVGPGRGGSLQIHGTKLTLRHTPGFEAVYKLARQCNAADIQAARAVEMLHSIHGEEAAGMADVFVQWCRGAHRLVPIKKEYDFVVRRQDVHNDTGFERYIELWPGVWDRLAAVSKKCTVQPSE